MLEKQCCKNGGVGVLTREFCTILVDLIFIKA